MNDHDNLRKCDECGDLVPMIFSLGSRERCFDCHMESPSWNIDEDYAGETYWDE